LPAQVAELHNHHRDVTGDWLRPAVFGVMDGLMSNAALLAGVVGLVPTPRNCGKSLRFGRHLIS
jgi:hypothetical protein